MSDLQRAGALNIINWRFIFTPITVSLIQAENNERLLRWRVLHIFGVRIMRWQVMA